MRRNIFEVSEDEKRRILGLHESATKNKYLIFEDPMQKDVTPSQPQLKDGTEPFANDTQYKYYAVSPSATEIAGVDLTAEDTFFVAIDLSTEDPYKATPTEFNDKNIPIKFDVNTKYTLPIYSQNIPIEYNTLLFFITPNNGTVKYTPSPKAENARIENAGVNGIIYDTTFLGWNMKTDSPVIIPIEFHDWSEYGGDFSKVRPEGMISYDELEQVGQAKFKPSFNVIYKQKGRKTYYQGVTVPNTQSGFPIPVATPPVPDNTDEVNIKFDNKGVDLFGFDSIKPSKNAENMVDELVTNIKSVYKTNPEIWGDFLTFLNSQNLKVLGYASKDGNPTEKVPAKNGCPASTRSEYNKCLSQKRADAIANLIKSKFKLNITGQGMGETTEFGPGWKE